MPSHVYLNHYEIIDQIGCGGMSVVYRALDTRTHRTVALKVLHPYLAQKEEYKTRLIREAHTTSRLEHPNILKIIGLESDGAELFIVTEFVEGMTLKQFASGHELSNTPEAGALIIWEVAQALHYAHAHGVTHRDIKPDNIMVSYDGNLKLMDFGIAHLSNEESLTVTGAMVGSPAHMAPELINGGPCDARTDVFSLATVFYWLTTGMLPFEGSNPHAVLKNVLEGNYQPIEEVSSRVLPSLKQVIEKGMATKPEDRFKSAQDFADAIQSALTFLPKRVDTILADPEHQLERLRQDVMLSALAAAKKELASGNFLQGMAFLNRILADDPFHAQALDLLEHSSDKRPSKKSKLVLITASVLALASATEIAVLSLDTNVMPAKAGIQEVHEKLDASLRWHDKSAPDPTIPTVPPNVMPAQAGIQEATQKLDASLRWHDKQKTSISVTPFADIYIDGRKVAQNTTALEVALDAGEHQISFRHEFAATQERHVRVVRGSGPQHIHVDLERVKPSSLVISSNIDADVAIDGAYKGTSFETQKHPILISFPKKAFSRKLEIVVSQKGYHPYVAFYMITPGKKQSINVKLEPDPS